MSVTVKKEIQLGKILSVVQQLKALSDKQYKAVVSYKLARSMQSIDNEITAYNSIVDEVRAKYGERQEDGTMKWYTETAQQEFLDEINEFVAQKVSIEIYPIKVSELNDNIAPRTLMDCSFLFSDFDETEEAPAPLAGAQADAGETPA